MKTGTIMEDRDDFKDEKILGLPVPAFSLPLFRDQGIIFLALLSFDIFLGPVVNYKEIVPVSEFVYQLKDSRRLSELYAGIAENNMTTLSISDKENVAIARYFHQSSDAATIVSILLVGTLPTVDVNRIQQVAQNTINRTQANPELIGKEFFANLKNYVDELQHELPSEKTKKPVKLIQEGRPIRSLNLQNIGGFYLIDLNSHIVDFRFLPQWLEDKSVDLKQLAEKSLDAIMSLKRGTVGSFFFSNLHFLIAKARNTDLVGFIYLPSPSPIFASHINSWILIFLDALAENWKQSSRNEIMAALQFLDVAGMRNQPKDQVLSIFHILLRSEKIKPITNQMNQKSFSIDPPPMVSSTQWASLKNLEGNISIMKLSEQWMSPTLNTVLLLNWAESRNLVSFLER